VAAAELSGTGPASERFRERSLTALLVSILLLIFVVTPFVEREAIGELAAGFLWALPGVLAALVVSRRRAAAIVILAATGIGLVTAIVGHPSFSSAVLSRGSAIVVLAVAGGVIADAVFGAGRVTWYRIQGGVALYLILALVFAHLFGLMSALVPQAFTGVPLGRSAHSVFFRGRLLYFSLATLTTTGYGDIVPVHVAARSLATLEAVIGQLYPATLLARLVTLELQGRRPPGQP